MTALRECWHCGPENSICEAVVNDYGKWQVYCGACGSSTGTCKTHYDAERAWNIRAYDAQLAALEQRAVAAEAERDALRERVSQVESTDNRYRCFHCGEVFDNAKCAAIHFGADEGRDPGCIEKVKGGELGLLCRVRELEEQLVPFLHETSAVENYVHSLKADHTQALVREEERGYNKGVRDMTAERDAALAQVETARKALEPFAKEAVHFDPSEDNDDDLLWAGHNLLIGDFYFARDTLAALAPAPDGGEGK